MASKSATKARKVSRGEDIKELRQFEAKLEAEWQQGGSEWLFDLLTLVRLFIRSASEPKPDLEKLDALREEFSAFIRKRGFLQGLDFVVQCMDSIRENAR
jgi:hypothetical protein